MKFELNCEKEIFKLKNEILNKTYHPDKSICFAVTKPVPREIFAASFRDRVIHHLIYNQIENIFEKSFTNQSCACRKEKGTHFALKYFRKYAKKITQNGTRDSYFLHLDIRSFFMSIDKNILMNMIVKIIGDPDLLWLIRKIIYNDPTKNYYCKSPKYLMSSVPRHKSLLGGSKDRGLPIGNLTSQFFANVYLNDLDMFVKHNLKAKYYLRYVDDFILLNSDLETLKNWQIKIEKFLKDRLKLDLNIQKTKFGQIKNGVDLVGYIIKPQYVLVRKRVVNACKERLYEFNKILENELPEEKKRFKILSVINSYFGHFHHADSFKLRKHLYTKHFGRIKEIIEPNDEKIISFKLI